MADAVDTSVPAPTFFSAWRPLLGYISVTALALNFVVFPTLGAVLAVFGKHPQLPTIDFEPMVALIVGVLGLGGMRTYEKATGCQGSH